MSRQREKKNEKKKKENRLKNQKVRKHRGENASLVPRGRQMSGLVDKGSVLFSQVHLFRGGGGGCCFIIFPISTTVKREGRDLPSTVLITRRKLTEKPG